ncbi:hypothetical protein LOD99_5773 [Oopsacas minuta]|uniref:Cell division cycle protein 123 homolog n=1 Tax=Oopsacas minuta TaxID=111878 RepID=A0AAV7JQH9_9METZ|nr:hypothetical protein LOD99_5773 [Oopsacas minuta]
MAEYSDNNPENEDLSKSLFCAQFNVWYPVFAKLTIPSLIIKLSKEFIEYIAGKSSQDSDEDISYGDEIIEPSFPSLEVEIAKCVKLLGGSVFPKLNWSAPCDAAWIKIGNSLKCKKFDEIYDLLKSSDTISTFDLSENIILSVAENAELFDHYLVLREWREIDTSLEFRCFVKNSNLIAISQRNHSDYYAFLSDIEMEVLELISKFFATEVKKKILLPNCVFDCYVQSDIMSVILVDFSPFNELTDALLFTWEELNGPWEGVKIRKKEVQGIYPNAKHLAGKVPKDFMDMATGEDPQKLLDLLNLSKEDFQNLKKL